MNLEDLLTGKENLMIRFLKLTEEALEKMEQKKEEDLPLIMDKRDKLIEEMKKIESELAKLDIKSEKQGIRIKELKARILTENQYLQERMVETFAELKENIGNNKKAIKVNKAYQGYAGQSLYLNKKN